MIGTSDATADPMRLNVCACLGLACSLDLAQRCPLTRPIQMHVYMGAGLPPPPELPLPPGLDSASAVPYQQKPIDLFKAIFEASDSDEDDDKEDNEKEDADDRPDVKPGDQGRSLGGAGSAAAAQISVKAAEQGTGTAGETEHCHHACHTCILSAVVHTSELVQLRGMLLAM